MEEDLRIAQTSCAGPVENMTKEDVDNIYALAERYDIPTNIDIREICRLLPQKLGSYIEMLPDELLFRIIELASEFPYTAQPYESVSQRFRDVSEELRSRRIVTSDPEMIAEFYRGDCLGVRDCKFGALLKSLRNIPLEDLLTLVPNLPQSVPKELFDAAINLDSIVWSCQWLFIRYLILIDSVEFGVLYESPTGYFTLRNVLEVINEFLSRTPTETEIQNVINTALDDIMKFSHIRTYIWMESDPRGRAFSKLANFLGYTASGHPILKTFQGGELTFGQTLAPFDSIYLKACDNLDKCLCPSLKTTYDKSIPKKKEE
jgi:hypothetical protein